MIKLRKEDQQIIREALLKIAAFTGEDIPFGMLAKLPGATTAKPKPKMPGKGKQLKRRSSRSRDAAGLVGKRTPIYGIYKGKRFDGFLLKDGTIEYNGYIYASPSAAALDCLPESRPTVNGWIFWKFASTDATLAEFHDFYNAG